MGLLTLKLTLGSVSPHHGETIEERRKNKLCKYNNNPDFITRGFKKIIGIRGV